MQLYVYLYLCLYFFLFHVDLYQNVHGLGRLLSDLARGRGDDAYLCFCLLNDLHLLTGLWDDDHGHGHWDGHGCGLFLFLCLYRDDDLYLCLFDFGPDHGRDAGRGMCLDVSTTFSRNVQTHTIINCFGTGI